jgi:hypothetical protein
MPAVCQLRCSQVRAIQQYRSETMVMNERHFRRIENGTEFVRHCALHSKGRPRDALSRALGCK